MARLREYKYEEGYHLRGYVNGNTTLQVHPIAADLFDWLGFEDGDSIPDSLTYGLLDFGLLYTKDPTSTPGDSVEFKQDEIENELDQRQYQQFVGFVKSYDSSPPESIKALVEQLNTQNIEVNSSAIPDRQRREEDHSNSKNHDVDHGTFSDIIEDIFTDGESYDQNAFRSEMASYLKEWGVSGEPRELLEEIRLDRSFAAAVEYPFDIGEVTLSKDALSYKTVLPTPPMWLSENGIECLIIIPREPETDTIRVEVLVHLKEPLASSETVDDMCLHQVDIDTSLGIIEDWTTTVSEDSSAYHDVGQATIFSQQALILDCLAKAADRHPQLVLDAPLSAIEKFLINTTIVDSEVIEASALLNENGNTPLSDDRAQGVVDFFNDTGGYGFISTDASEEDVFFHMEDVGGPDLKEEQVVEFGIEQAEKGPRAINLTRV